MNENEIMTKNEEVIEEPEVIEEERSQMSPGVAMLIGSGLTLAGIAVVKKGKKVWAKIKAKKNAKNDDGSNTEEKVIDVNFEETSENDEK